MGDMRIACVMVLVAGSAWAGKTVVLTAGDCSDAALINSARDFRDAARPLLASEVIEDESVLDIVRPRPARGLQDLARQVESAKTLFYDGQNDRALELVQRAVTELERAEPDSKPWPVLESALLLQAEIEKNLGHTTEMKDAFRRVVRINPKVKLNPDAHAPSVIAAVEAMKKELAKSKKGTLQVRVDNGPAATVAIDGLVVGATPLKLELVPGSYRVSLFSGGQLSFPHRVELPREGALLSVEYGFEGAVSRQAPLCVSAAADGHALKLAQLVGAEKVIILRNRAQQGGPTYLSGTLYDLATATEERTGSVAPGLIRNLATFLVTGKSQEGVQQLKPPPMVTAAPGESPPPPPVAETPPATVEAKREAPPVEQALEPAAPVETAVKAGWPPMRTAGVVMLASGVAVAGGGVGLYLGGTETRARLQALKQPDGTYGVTDRERADAAYLLPQRTFFDVGGVAMMAVGGAAAVTGAVLLVVAPPGTPVVTAAPTTGGAQVMVSGSF